jgi:hypothetical protein
VFLLVGWMLIKSGQNDNAPREAVA